MAEIADEGILSTEDATDVLEELLEAQNHAKYIGLKLKVPQHVLDGAYSEPRERLYAVIMEYLKQVEPRPTWRGIVNSLRSSLVNLSPLALKIERKYIPSFGCAIQKYIPSGTSTPTPPDQVTQSPQSTADGHESTGTSSNLQPSSRSAVVASNNPAVTVEEIKAKITDFEDRFKALKRSTREDLDRRHISVKRVIECLTELRADDMPDHKVFLEDNIHTLFKSEDNAELFASMNLHWDYLAFDLLDHIIKEFEVEEAKAGMERYKGDMKQFRKNSPLKLYCKAQKKRRQKPPAEFREVVAEFDWPEDVTLETVEDFRQEFASQYGLRECAMMLSSIRGGSFIVTWFIPESTVERLLANPADNIILEKHNVRHLEIAGCQVYSKQKGQFLMSSSATAELAGTAAQTSLHQSAVGFEGREDQRQQEYQDTPLASDGLSTGITTGPTSQPSSHDKAESQSTEQEYDFVEQPSVDFFCPVTKDLLLQPNLTACCGHHLSGEAATRILGEGGACPMCKETNWSTMLDKQLRRKVQELRVFCHHKERGCRWEGKLSALEQHVRSCPKKNSPIETNMKNLSPPSADERDAKAQESLRKEQLTLQCNTKATPPPCVMMRGAATTDKEFAYFSPMRSNSIYSYKIKADKWQELPPCPNVDSGLVVVDGALTAVGGENGWQCTNEVFTLRNHKWVEELPPMNTLHSCPAVVSVSRGNRTIVIVIGGFKGGAQNSDAVELFNAGSKKWLSLTNLPEPLSRPSAAIYADQLYVIDVGGNGYSCSIQSLQDSASSDSLLQPLPSELTWEPLPLVPLEWSTAAALKGRIVTIGGLEREKATPTSCINQLVDGRWVTVGWLSSERWWCSVVSPSADVTVVLGGMGTFKGVEIIVAL